LEKIHHWFRQSPKKKNREMVFTKRNLGKKNGNLHTGQKQLLRETKKKHARLQKPGREDMSSCQNKLSDGKTKNRKKKTRGSPTEERAGKREA